MSHQTKKALRITFLAMISALVFQIAKEAFIPRLSIWGSHILTILFITVSTFVVSKVMIRRDAEAENALREGEQRFRSVLQNGLDGFYIVDTSGKLLDVNDAYCAMSGYTREELLQMRVPELEHIESEQEIAAHIQRVIRVGNDRFESRHCRKDGKVIDIETSVDFQNFNGGRFFCFLRDITERKRTEQALRKSEEHHRRIEAELRAFVEKSPLAIFRTHVEEDRFLSVNPAVVKMLGYASEEELLSAKLSTDVYVNSQDRENALMAILHDGSSGTEIQCRRKNGEIVTIRLSGRLVHESFICGSVFEAIAEDITERKRAEQSLQESEKRFRQVVEGSPVGMYIQTDGILQYFNPAALAMFGAERASQIIGRGYLEVIHPDTRPAVIERARRVQEERKAVPFLEERLLRLDGTVFDGEATAVPFAFGGRDGAVVFVRDITGRKREEGVRRALEEQLQQAQKMEAIGQLAGSVAHDFNNLLMGISMQAELLPQTADRCKTEERARMILSSTESAGKLTKKLLAFSRKQELATSTFDLNQPVAEMKEFIGRLLSENIDVEARLWPAPCWVSADRGQMEQTLINLVLNSRDAMPRGGKIIISTSSIDIDENGLGLHRDVPAGAYVMIAVADTGHGIPEENLGRIFEPFFTTKPKERGTGLGLSIAFGFVSQNGGHIRVRSTVGVGTTFSIYLPSVGRPQTDQLNSHAPPDAPCQVKGTILVVDDDAVVRTSVRTYLELKGMTVFDCVGAFEALKVASELNEQLALLITDVAMPEMTGTELAHALVSRMPELPIIFMSGYAAGQSGHEEFKQAKFVQKPFTGAILLDAVRGAAKVPSS